MINQNEYLIKIFFLVILIFQFNRKKRMSDQETIVRSAIAQFYKTKKYEEGRQKLLKLADHLSKKHLQEMYINNLFAQFKKHSSSENFSQQTKRFLIILHEILLKDFERKEDRKYSNVVSAHLIEIYTYIFKHVFKNISQLSDLIIVLKMYRMQWAKIITDSCFDSIKTEISRQFSNFDMDKGFNQDMIEKIIRKYRKRGFSEQQIPRYLSCLKKTTVIQKNSTANHQTRQRYHPSSSSESEESERQKFNQQEDAQFSDDSQIIGKPSKKIKISPQYGANQYQRKQFESAYLNLPSSGYPYQQRQINATTRAQMPPVSQIYGYGGNNSSFFDQKNNQRSQNSGLILSSNSYHPYKYVQTQADNRYETSNQNYFNFQGIVKDLFQGIIQCKQCGAFFPNQKLYDSHIQDHFQKAKNDFQFNHKKEGKQRQILRNEQEWIEGSKLDLSKVKFRVRVRNDQIGNVQCAFCCNTFEISWSDQISEWIYENAVQAMILIGSEKKMELVHFDCYKIFNQEESSN